MKSKFRFAIDIFFFDKSLHTTQTTSKYLSKCFSEGLRIYLYPYPSISISFALMGAVETPRPPFFQISRKRAAVFGIPCHVSFPHRYVVKKNQTHSDLTSETV